MSTTYTTILLLLYGFALWLGMYLVGRDPRSLRLWWTAGGLVAYALALACELLAAPGPTLHSLQSALLALTPLCWTSALLLLLPPDSALRGRAMRWWALAFAPVALLLLLEQALRGTPALRLALIAVVLGPMALALAWLWRLFRQQRLANGTGLVIIATLFFGMSIGLVLVPFSLLPRFWLLALVGVDLLLLGAAIARYDALDLGETLRDDMLRSLAATTLVTSLFVVQVVLALTLSGSFGPPLRALLLSVVASSIAVSVFTNLIDAAVDRLVLGQRPGVRQARAALRATATALPRRNPLLDPATLDEAEFARLTRRALSHFGDLSHLAASPLINLSVVEQRLAERGAPDDALERAIELKAVLTESIVRLKPRTGDEFGTSDEWRYYNALYFPYIVGLKPYSTRSIEAPATPEVRAALEWFRSSVPERTLYNWQRAAAKLVAHDLRTRG